MILIRIARFLRTIADRLDSRDRDTEAAHIAGFCTAAHEIGCGRASLRDAKERGLHSDNQDLRIAWDRGYEEAICAYRLGSDVHVMVRLGLYEVPHKAITIVEEIERRGAECLLSDPRRRSS